MAPLGFICFSLHSGIARSRLRVWFHFSYHLRPRGRKIIWILQLDPNMPLVGIEPGPPVQQARALSITPLPPGSNFTRWLYSSWNFIKCGLRSFSPWSKSFYYMSFVFVLWWRPEQVLAGLPSRVTALPYANYKTKSELLHSCQLILLYYYYL